MCHDHIQQIFPNNQISVHASTYPVITLNTIKLIKDTNKMVEIQHNLINALIRMYQFYAIDNYNDINIQRKWCVNYNHNLLRITRIIRSLRLFELNIQAKDFYNTVLKIAKLRDINSITLDYWNIAINDDLWNI